MKTILSCALLLSLACCVTFFFCSCDKVDLFSDVPLSERYVSARHKVSILKPMDWTVYDSQTNSADFKAVAESLAPEYTGGDLVCMFSVLKGFPVIMVIVGPEAQDLEGLQNMLKEQFLRHSSDVEKWPEIVRGPQRSYIVSECSSEDQTYGPVIDIDYVFISDGRKIIVSSTLQKDKYEKFLPLVQKVSESIEFW